MTSTNPLVQAALQDYVDRIDRGEEIDVAAFVVQHADVADELRSFIALDLEARRLAGGAAPVVGSPLSKAPAVKPPPTNAEVSTHSIVGSIEGTAGGKPKSADPQTAPAAVEKSTGNLPDVFGRYRVQKKLGSGAMGAVYLAEDTLLHRKVALKTPTFGGDKDGELLRRFYREARAVANLKHPNLCAVYDVGEIGGHHYISMEFVRGKKLQDYINPDKPMSEKQAMAVVRKIALAMHESHTQGVIHRDLKPDNIMVNEKGEPVVMDFGLVYKTESKNSTRITQRGMLVGSPAYMSKEQVEGDPDKLTAATDQYSLGVILYQLLTSKLPFEGGIHAVLASILTKEPSPPCQFRTDLNPHLEAVCLKMMAKEAKDRYPSMKAVAEAIAEVAKATSKGAGSVVVPAQVDGSMTDGLTATFAGFSVATEQKLPFLSVTNSFVKARVRRPIQKRSNSLLYTVVAAAALLLLLSVIVWIRSGNALVKISVHVDDVEVTFQNETLTLVDGTHEYQVVPGEHVLHIKSKDAEFDTDTFTLKRGENPVVTVEVIESEIVTRLGNEVISRISQQPFAPADSLVFQDKRFKLFAEQLTWHEAQRKCRAMGGRMAEVRSSIENDFLMKLALNAKQTGIWLGSTDEVQQGTWLWSDDSGLAFNYFANGQPDRRTTGQHYLLMMIKSQRGQWCSQPDRSMEWTPGFICEWDIDDLDKAHLPPLEAADSSDATSESVSNLDRVAVGIWRPLIEATAPAPESGKDAQRKTAPHVVNDQTIVPRNWARKSPGSHELRNDTAASPGNAEDISANVIPSAKPIPRTKSPVVTPTPNVSISEEDRARIAAHPQPFDGYEIIQELGRGGMGVVYRARSKADGSLVAIKVVLPAVASSPDDLARFVREAGIVKELSHPHIVQFRDLGHANGQLFFAMDLVPGVNGLAFLRHQDGPLPVARAVKIVRQILQALSAAHCDIAS